VGSGTNGKKKGRGEVSQIMKEKKSLPHVHHPQGGHEVSAGIKKKGDAMGSPRKDPGDREQRRKRPSGGGKEGKIYYSITGRRQTLGGGFTWKEGVQNVTNSYEG